MTIADLPKYVRNNLYNELGAVERIANRLGNTVKYRDDVNPLDIMDRLVEVSIIIGHVQETVAKELRSKT